MHLWTFHLDCSQSPVPRKIVGIEHLPLRAAILVSKVPRQAWGLVSNLRRGGGGGMGQDGLGVGEKYLFSFFLAPLPHCSKPRGPPPSVHLKTRWPRLTVSAWSRDFFQKNWKLQAVYFPLCSFKQRTFWNKNERHWRKLTRWTSIKRTIIFF